MINLKKLPVDCSVETLFPEAEQMFKMVEPLGYASQYAGVGMTLKIPFWDTTLDPAEDNIRKQDGTIDHDNYICLCKWVDGSSITFRYNKNDLVKN
jgi:hypothetical protein